jgi:hypothetical protein
MQCPNIVYYYKKNFKIFKRTYMEMAFVVIVVATQKIQKNSAFHLAKRKKKKEKSFIKFLIQNKRDNLE